MSPKLNVSCWNTCHLFPQLLTQCGFSVTYIYSSLDPAARKINAAKFSLGKVKILIVTDLAARGIDVPLLDNVINFHFPAKPKLFVHRVGKLSPCLLKYLSPFVFVHSPYLFFLQNIELKYLTNVLNLWVPSSSPTRFLQL